MSKKKLIPCIYLYQTNAVYDFQSSKIVSEDPVELAKTYASLNCDGIVVFDLSTNDKEHDEAIDIIKAICESVNVPIIGAGNVKRMEDIKKLLYAGCRQAVLNYSKESNVSITQEVSQKFGKDKIVVSIKDPVEITDSADLIEEYCGEVLYIRTTKIKEAVAVSPVPVMLSLPEFTLDKLTELLKLENVSGVTGESVTQNVKEISAMKDILEENGVNIMKFRANYAFEDFKLNSDGHIPVVVQDDKTDEVLMVAYMDKEAYETTIKTGTMTYFSRSKQRIWVKGETSGHFQYVKSLSVDCDLDTILARVTQIGPACHTGSKTCFFNSIVDSNEQKTDNPLHVFQDVYDVIMDRKLHPKEGSYTNYLFDKGVDKILKKLGEEATEIVIAAKNPNPNEIKYEISDFLYHMMVLMAEKGVTWDEIVEDLAKR